MADLLNPHAELRRAAFGDLEAMRNLSGMAASTFDLEGCPLVLLEGLPFARMAAMHGHECDSSALFNLLGKAASAFAEIGDAETAAYLSAEAVAHLSRMADQGSDEAADTLSRFVSMCSPNEAEWGREIYSMMMEKGALA